MKKGTKSKSTTVKGRKGPPVVTLSSKKMTTKKPSPKSY